MSDGGAGKPFEVTVVVAGHGAIDFDWSEQKIREYVEGVGRRLGLLTPTDRAGAARTAYTILDRMLRDRDDPPGLFSFTDKGGRAWLVRPSAVTALALRDPSAPPETSQSFGFRPDKP